MASAYELYLIRHGIAEERGEAWPDDTKRPLTDRGMARLQEGSARARALGVSFDVVLTSPLVRARQTAEVVAGAFDPRPPIVTVESLAPGGTFRRCWPTSKSSRGARVSRSSATSRAWANWPRG